MSGYRRAVGIGSFLVFFLILVLLLARNLDSGVILGEPDEYVHAQIAQNLLKTPFPYYSGSPFFYDLPGLFVIGSLVTKFVNDPLISVRLISLFSTILLGVAICFYLRTKHLTLWAALFGSLLFYFSPLTIFYSQVGLIEPLVSLFLFCFLMFYDLFLERNQLKYSFVSGLFLAAALFTKYTALYFILVALVIFIYKSLIVSLKEITKRRTDYLLLDLKALIPLAIPVVTVLPVIVFFYTRFPIEFKIQTYQVLGVTRMAVFLLFTNLNAETAGNILWWVPLPILLGTLFGFFAFLARFKSRSLFCLLIFVISLVLVLSRAPFHPRYFIVLLPFLAILNATFLDFVINRLPIRVGLKAALFITLLLFFVLVYRGVIYESYFSAKHNVLERVAEVITADPSAKGKWVLSNYWPNIVASKMLGHPYAWLTLDNNEIRIFNPEESQTGLEIINEGRAVIVVENKYTATLVYSPSRYEALTRVKSLKPDFVMEDTMPNFPFFRDSTNRINVYLPDSL